MNDDAGAARREAGRDPVDRAAAANYVAELSAELAKLARRHGLDALGYILDMARLEAENATRHVNGTAARLCTLDPHLSISAAFGWPSVTRPCFFCSARTKSRILKSMWAENRVWS